MTKQNLMDPVLSRILQGYGMQVKTAGRKSAEECQDGVNSELTNEDSGSDVSEDSLFAPQEAMYKEEGSTEGGHYISDGQLETPETPSGESPSFENYMTGDEGGAETKKTVEDPGYQPGASVTSELSISGGTVDKGAAFLKMAQEFVPIHENFLNSLAAVAYQLKLASADPATMDPAMMDPAATGGGEMDPMGAMAQMAGPGQGDEGMVEEGTGELDPQDEALVEALIETQTGENPLTDDELAQIEMILESSEAAEGAPAEEEMMMDPAMMDPAAMGGEEAKIASSVARDFAAGKYQPPPSHLGQLASGASAAAFKSSPRIPQQQQLPSKYPWLPGVLSKYRPQPGLAAPMPRSGAASRNKGGAYKYASEEFAPVEAAPEELAPEEIAAIIDSLPEEEVEALIEAIEAEEAAMPVDEPEIGPEELELLATLEGAGAMDEPAAGEPSEEELIAALAGDEEPELSEEEAESIAEVSEAADAADEIKEAAYYGMTVEELRVAKDAAYKEQLIREKQARLQAKNANQARKAQRYGRLIDSLIRN